MFDAIVIGAGPAGISSALYLKRANKNVLVLYYGQSQLEKAHKIDNYYGFKEGITGKDLYESGIDQAKNLGIEVKKEEVLDVNMLGLNDFEVVTTNASYKALNVIVATGTKKIRPNIKGILEFEGIGVSYCAVCDAFFFRNKRIGVIGNSKYALSEASFLKNVTDNICILTDGLNPDFKSDIKVYETKIDEIIGTTKVTGVKFKDGKTLDLDGIFVALGSASGADFAKKLGIVMDKDNFKVDNNMETNVKGIYACGNLTGGLLQVNKAVYEGALAALDIVKKLNSGE